MPHLAAVFRAALSLAGREDQAHDLAQATFLKALEAFENFQERGNCKAWLMRILRNNWIDQLRKNSLMRECPLEVEPADRPPAQQDSGDLSLAGLMETLSDKVVLKAMAKLPPDQRLALLLVDVEGMDHQEVAAIIGVAVGTVKSRTSRARALLRLQLLEHATDLGLVKRCT